MTADSYRDSIEEARRTVVDVLMILHGDVDTRNAIGRDDRGEYLYKRVLRAIQDAYEKGVRDESRSWQEAAAADYLRSKQTPGGPSA